LSLSKIGNWLTRWPFSWRKWWSSIGIVGNAFPDKSIGCF
jgi:hypothetical protein